MTSLSVVTANPWRELIFFSYSAWKHWGCVTPTIIKKISDAADIDGYQELKPEDQQRVATAIEAGHVAPEDVPGSSRKPESEEEKSKRARRAPKKNEEGEDRQMAHGSLGPNEIVTLIAANLVSDKATASAVALARCARSLEEPVLCEVWRTLSSLTPLVKCFPPELWEIRDGKLASTTTIYTTDLTDSR